jgi:hypothetical protein
VNELRELLQDRADSFELPPGIPLRVLRRARVRRVINGALAGVLATGLAIAGVVGIQSLTRDRPETPGAPSVKPGSEWQGVWPFDTREGAEAAQAEVDQGKQRWLLSGRAVVSNFAEERFGWNQVFFIEDVDLDDRELAGPVIVRIVNCDRVAHPLCRGARASVTIDRLGRSPTSIWLVTDFIAPVSVGHG